MQMLYNSDSFAVLQFDVPAEGARGSRGGFEIVDKLARKDIFLEGALAQRFREGVQALIESDPGPEAFDDFIEGYANLLQQPLVLH
jgi:hypothetical protein